MSETRQRQTASDADLLGALGPNDQGDLGGAPSQSRVRSWLLRGAVAVLVIALAAAGFAMLSPRVEGERNAGIIPHRAARGDLLVTVTEDGTVESAENLQIKCEISGGTTILWLIEDGVEVEQGQVLAKLDSSKLDEEISQQKIAVEKARALFVQAEKDFNVAKIAIREYLDGTYKQELQRLESDITIAKENLSSAENTLQYTQRMFRKGYATVLQRDAKEFAVQRAKLDLDLALTAKTVLTEFTRAKQLEDLNSQRDTAEAKMRSEKASLDLEEARLRRLEAEREKCVIRAPKAGMVVYANELSRRGPPGSRDVQIEEGAAVREQQDIFRLPDLSRMQVKTAVHETKVEHLRPGMRAVIHVLGRELPGKVISVASQPEPTSFFSANVKEYATIVTIEGERKELRPGMTAEVEILVTHRKNVLTLPVAALVEQRSKFVCWVQAHGQVERRPLKLGPTNNKFVEIEDGVAEGEIVVLNPRAVIEEAREKGLSTEEEDAPTRFDSPAGEGAGLPTSPGVMPSPAGAGPDAESGPRGGSGFPSPPGGSPGGRRGPPDFSTLDKDGDGRLSREEAPGPMANFFDSIDTNGDGFVDRKEHAALLSRFRGGDGPPGGPPPGGGPP
jgi:HlyD family secretion protein